jgi:hypothetical protein
VPAIVTKKLLRRRLKDKIIQTITEINLDVLRHMCAKIDQKWDVCRITLSSHIEMFCGR